MIRAAIQTLFFGALAMASSPPPENMISVLFWMAAGAALNDLLKQMLTSEPRTDPE